METNDMEINLSDGATVTAQVILALPMLGHKVVSWMPTPDTSYMAAAVLHGNTYLHTNITDAVAQVLRAGSFSIGEIAKAERNLHTLGL